MGSYHQGTDANLLWPQLSKPVYGGQSFCGHTKSHRLQTSMVQRLHPTHWFKNKRKQQQWLEFKKKTIVSFKCWGDATATQKRIYHKKKKEDISQHSSCTSYDLESVCVYVYILTCCFSDSSHHYPCRIQIPIISYHPTID